MDPISTTSIEVMSLVRKTSRTFALALPLLPEPTRAEAAVGYLFFRVLETFRRAHRWTVDARLSALERFPALLDGGLDVQHPLLIEWLREPPVRDESYFDLVGQLPTVWMNFKRLRGAARQCIRDRVARSAAAAAAVVKREVAPELLGQQSLELLGSDSHAISGIACEMLTDLFLLDRAALERRGDELRERAAAFGEGLQLVHILRDLAVDHQAIYLSGGVDLQPVFRRAEACLRDGARYTEILWEGGPETGLVLFSAFAVKLAIGNLRLIQDQGIGTRLPAEEIVRIAVELSAERTGACPVFPGL